MTIGMTGATSLIDEISIVTNSDGKLSVAFNVGLEHQVLYTGDINDYCPLIAFSSTLWHTQNRRTTDAGVTWADDAGLINVNYSIMLKSSATNGIAVKDTDGSTLITTDAGATTWVAATVAPALTTVCDGDTYGTNKFVLCGVNAGAKGISFSTDGGSNWTTATTGPANNKKVYAISMYDATTGFCIDTDLKIWKTTDACVNWTDTTHKAPDVDGYLKATSATSFIYMVGKCKEGTTQEGLTIYTYNETTGTITTRLVLGTSAISKLTNIVKATNGNYYFITVSVYEAANTPFYNVILFKSTNSGTTWTLKEIPVLLTSGDGGAGLYPSTLVEYDTNKLMLSSLAGILTKIDSI